MSIHLLIAEITDFLEKVYQETEKWFEKEDKILHYIPNNKGWTIAEILEHIALTNHFLLILIEKGTKKALKQAENRNFEAELTGYVFHRDRLDEVGIYQSFEWIRPAHMQPRGEKNLVEIKQELHSQVLRCKDFLAQLQNGEGILYKTTMTVNHLGKIDVYEYIYFLGKHIERHIQQMQKNELAFTALHTL